MWLPKTGGHLRHLVAQDNRLPKTEVAQNKIRVLLYDIKSDHIFIYDYDNNINMKEYKCDTHPFCHADLSVPSLQELWSLYGTLYCFPVLSSSGTS